VLAPATISSTEFAAAIVFVADAVVILGIMPSLLIFLVGIT
jgi:hypothetical protein